MTSTAAPSHPQVPSYHILTPRLAIRPPTAADAPTLASYLTDPARTAEPQDPADLTPAVLRARIEEKWAGSRAEGANAWLVMLLRREEKAGDEDEEEEEKEEELIGFGGYNSFPRTRLLNSAERKSDAVPEADKVLVADVGVGIDTRYQRKGYAREALCGMAEYAFATLGAGYVHLDTPRGNAAFRAVMRDVGIPEKTPPGGGGGGGGGGEDKEEEHKDDDAVFKFASKNLNYDFDEGMWEGIRDDLRTRGKWPL